MDHLQAEISAARVRSNLRKLVDLVGSDTEVCPVVKANAYGHGLEQVLPALTDLVRTLAVATPTEAIELREHGWHGSVLSLMTPSALPAGDRDSLDRLIAERITMTVVSPEEVDAVSAACQRLGTAADVHLKIDTGMGRGGVGVQEAMSLISKTREAVEPSLTGLYTHFATADEPDLSPAQKQLDRFKAVVAEAGGGDGVRLHAANSAATLRLPAARLDMVRCGLALYGYFPGPGIERPVDLDPVMRVSSHLTQVKSVPAGSCCGYGLEYEFSRESRIALVPMGYGDGYMRSLAGKAVVLVEGQIVPVRGNISMDQLIVDVTDVSGAGVGSPVVVMSENREDPNSIEALAAQAGTTPYEMTVRIGSRVRRVLADF